MTTFQDLSGRGATGRTLFVRGLLTLLVIGLCTGAFRYATDRDDGSVLTVATLTDADVSGLTIGSPVLLHDTTIGSVAAIATESQAHRIELDLQPSAAALLTDAAATRIVATNLFGAASIDIEPGSHSGHRLVSGAVLSSKGRPGRTLIDVMRRLGDLIALPGIDTLQYGAEHDVQDGAAALAATIRVATALTDIIQPSGSEPSAVTDFASRAAVIASSATQLTTGQLALMRSVLEHSDALITHRDGLVTAFSGVGDLFDSGADLLESDQLIRDLTLIVDTVEGPLLPVVITLCTIPSAYNRAGQLISRIDGAIPLRDGKPVLQVDLAARVPFLSASATGENPR